jgi:hypothetical protein
MSNGKDLRKAQKAIKAGKPVVNPYKQDVLYTDMGQWMYPGQVTKIPSNQITMQGVPYPVQGVDDTGYSQMMYPGMNYTFPGQYVTEYPMAAYGGDPSLPNITGHYQGGGWLDTLQNGGLRAASTTGASAVSTKAPQVPLNNTDNYKTGIQYIQEKWKNRDPSDNWNLLMPDKYGSYVDSGVDPFALMLAAPQGAIKTAKAAGKYLTEKTPLKNAKTVNDKIADIKNKVADSRISTINDINKLKSERPRNFTENPNKFLSGEWKNTNQNFVNQNPLDANDFNGLREAPIDPKYLDNFLLNNKPSEGIPLNKYGGQKKLKRTTSKNIQSSINDLMLRNETLFGPPGRVRYKPKLKYGQGGWLDQFDK